MILIVKRNVKYPCWYLRHQIRYMSKFFFIFKGSRKPNPIQTIRQSRFDIWDYTFSRRVKVFRHSFWETKNRCHPKSDFILVRFAEFFTSLEGYLLNTISSWCRIVSSRYRSRKIWTLSISKFFVYCCHSDIDFTKNYILTNFNS